MHRINGVSAITLFLSLHQQPQSSFRVLTPFHYVQTITASPLMKLINIHSVYSVHYVVKNSQSEIKPQVAIPS
jgi:hypothetical protein